MKVCSNFIANCKWRKKSQFDFLFFEKKTYSADSMRNMELVKMKLFAYIRLTTPISIANFKFNYLLNTYNNFQRKIENSIDFTKTGKISDSPVGTFPTLFTASAHLHSNATSVFTWDLVLKDVLIVSLSFPVASSSLLSNWGRVLNNPL